MSIARRRLLPVLAALAVLFLSRAPARAFDVVLSAQGEFMDAYLVNGTAFPPKYVFIDPDPADPSSITGTPPRVGRHVNGKLCFFPRGLGYNGQFVVGDDTYREACPSARIRASRRRATSTPRAASSTRGGTCMGTTSARATPPT